MSDHSHPNSFDAAVDRFVDSRPALPERSRLAEHQQVPFRTFHNGLRVLLNVDAHDLLSCGVIERMGDFRSFEANPFLWMIRAPDAAAERLWLLIEQQQPACLRAPEPLKQAA